MKIAFFEPPYSVKADSLWRIRVSVRYPPFLDAIEGLGELFLVLPNKMPLNDPFYKEFVDTYGLKVLVQPDCDPSDPYSVADSILHATRGNDIDFFSTLSGRGLSICYGILLASRILGNKYIWHVHGDDLSTKASVWITKGKVFPLMKEYWEISGIERNLAQGSHKIIVMSEKETKRIMSLGAPSQKIILSSIGINTNLFSYRKTSIKPERPIRVLFVGRNSPEKNIELLDSVAETCLGMGLKLKFYIAGPSFQKRKVRNRVYLGFVQPFDLPALYSSCHIFLITSKTEAAPIAIKEAMASGLPCIVPKHIFRDDFVQDGVVLFSENTISSIVKCILRLVSDIHFANVVGKKAYSYAQKYLDKRLFQSAYEEAFLV